MLPYLWAPHQGPVNFLFDFNIDLLKVSVIKTNCSSKLVFFAGLQMPIKLPCLGTDGALQEVSHGNRKSLGTHTLQFNIFLISLFSSCLAKPPPLNGKPNGAQEGCSLCCSILCVLSALAYMTPLISPSFPTDLGKIMMHIALPHLL